MSVPRAHSQSVIVGVVSCGRKTKVRRSVQRTKFSCSKLLLRLKMAKCCQEEYEDVSEVLHPSTLSTTLLVYIASSPICQTLSPLPYSLLRQCPFSLYRSLLLNSAFRTRSTCTWLSSPQKNRSNATAPCPSQLKCDGISSVTDIYIQTRCDYAARLVASCYR